ncbi:hypothetical protein GGR23_001933 [Gellertiella hungarica]|uniref:Uncharacterized protein n=1 Tax=Gellertiella hungarica TaxID=1572859 RepID=A0A7W6J6C8_9HYPH|nr:hypothetical protein [Gellertiella hungarica]
MARARDFTKARAADRAARQGTDSVVDFGLPGGLTPPRKRPSKADQRAEAAAAVAQVTRLVHCQCGHKAAVTIPTSWRGRSLKCSRCGERCQA